MSLTRSKRKWYAEAGAGAEATQFFVLERTRRARQTAGWALRFPPELFALIFAHLTKKCEHQCRLVCRQWRVLVDTRYPFRCGIHVFSWGDDSLAGWETPCFTKRCGIPIRALPLGKSPPRCACCRVVICRRCLNSSDVGSNPDDTCAECQKYSNVCADCVDFHYFPCDECHDLICTKHLDDYPVDCRDCDTWFCKECAEKRDLCVCEKCNFRVCGECASLFDGDPTCKSCKEKYFKGRVPDGVLE